MLRLLSPENLEVDTMYTLSISINHKVGPLKSNINAYLRKVRDYLIPYAHFELFPELSSQGRLHYHGWILFKSLENIFWFYKNLYGCQDLSMEIDTIEDPNKWNDYCRKSEKFKFIFKEKLLPYALKSFPK